MSIELRVNGKLFEVDVTKLPPDITLNTYIREHVGLSGTKFMCLEGGCGVCICAVKKNHTPSGDGKTFAVNSCLTLLNICDGWDITTIEGIGDKLKGYHPIQKQLADFNGSQCGYCSPGMVMNMFSLLKSKAGKVTMTEVENSFGGNICRCTGYRPILDAMKSFATDSNCERVECPDIEDLTGKCTRSGQECNGVCKQSHLIYKSGFQWFWPKSLKDLLEIVSSLRDETYMLASGNTAHGVYRRKDDVRYFIDVNISDLQTYEIDRDLLTLGANLSLTEAMEIFQKASRVPGFEYCQELYSHFDLIANVPVRNMGTLAGNLMIKHTHPEFPSDVFITFKALDVMAIIGDVAGVETITLNTFLKMDMKGKVIIAFRLKPYSRGKYIFKSYKIMPRAQNAHAYVNSAFLVELNPVNRKIVSDRICFGGINSDFCHASSTEKRLTEVDLFSNGTLTDLFEGLNSELNADYVPPDASAEYRRKLACGLFYKFLLSIAPVNKIPDEFRSGGDLLKRGTSSGRQVFQTTLETYPISEPIKKLEAVVQCSGEAQYMNDFPNQPNQVWCAFVNATKVGSEILAIDPSEALKTHGVVAFYSAEDIPGSNSFVDTTESFFGIHQNEQVFCTGAAKYHNQPLGMIVAESSALANCAAAKVKVTYGSVNKKILPTMDDVMEANETDRISDVFVSSTKELHLASSSAVFASGSLKLGQQYHFTLEPHTTIAVPVEGKLEVYSSTQWMDLTQCAIAKCVKMNMCDVQLKVRRLGGGFGAKITRGNHVACAAALAAVKLNRPARFVQTIESMMGSLGKRWACNSEYEFHVDCNGKILGLQNLFFEDAGYISNENAIEAITGPSLRNCYDFKDSNYNVNGKIVLTDSPSHTWCRGPGSVEGFAMIETIMEHIAFETGQDPVDVRLQNIASDHKIRGVVEGFIKSSEYLERKEQIESFNRRNRWRKKGLGVSLMQFDVFFFGPFPATVSIYHGDGTVVISHGGIEMGQGMNTKAAQLAAYLFGIPVEMIRIESSNSVNGANAMFTGASIGSECVCYAIRKACETLLSRLLPFREQISNNSWVSLVELAHSRGINLIASDQFTEGDIEAYAIYGASLTEVEVDILTGNLLINRVDILEDTGESLNPAIDVGQIEGAFVMGLGYFLTEQIVYDRKTGEQLTNRTWNYKPPGCKDIPIDFRIELIQKSPNPAGFMRSKTTGEPAICMAVSVLFAIQYALQSARDDAGLKRKWICLGAPTTPEQIVLNSGLCFGFGKQL